MNNSLSPMDQTRLVRSLALLLEKQGQRVRIFETHISWVLVGEKFAYKFKKALQLDFLDFSTLEARQFYCREECRLNRRLAPDLYIGIVAVTGSIESPLIDGPGIAIEYAVSMHAFAQEDLWDYRISFGYLSVAEIDALARTIARFHHAAARAPDSSQWGTPGVIEHIADENLQLLASLVKDREPSQIDKIRAWQAIQHRCLNKLFENRKAIGMIRECHGDLHGGNILTINNRVEAFDCIEFNDSLRWIDVMSDIAFIYMDLDFHGCHDLAARLLNQYLEASGDYEGVGVLRYYQIQHALVRCKVGLLRNGQLNANAQDAAVDKSPAKRYLAYSVARSRKPSTAIMITHGYSGSGKSTFSKSMVELVGAIQIRSDVERKRLHGLDATSRVAAAPGAGLYQAAVTVRTYDRLRQLARHAIEAGLPVIVDAAFLKKTQRLLFEHLAHELRVPFFIFDLQADEATLKERIQARAQFGRDPSDAGLGVLACQMAEHDALSGTEMSYVLALDTRSDMDRDTIRKIAAPVIKVLQSASPFGETFWSG